MNIQPLSNGAVIILCALFLFALTCIVSIVSQSIENIRRAYWAGIKEAASQERAEALARVHPRAPGLTDADLEPGSPYDQTKDRD